MPKATSEIEADCGRHLEPELARIHHVSEFREADARGRRRQCPVSGRMRIAAHDQLAGQRMAFFGNDLVLDPHARIVEMPDAELLHLLADAAVHLGHHRRVCRHPVVDHHDDLFRVEYLFETDVLQRLAGLGELRVIRHHEVDAGGNELAWRHPGSAGGPRQDLFRHRHADCRHHAVLLQGGPIRCAARRWHKGRLQNESPAR